MNHSKRLVAFAILVLFLTALFFVSKYIYDTPPVWWCNIYKTSNNCQKEGDECTVCEGDDCEGGASFKRDSDKKCTIVTACSSTAKNSDGQPLGYNLVGGKCVMKETNPLDGLTLITDDFTVPSELWPDSDQNMFKLDPGQYIESTEIGTPANDANECNVGDDEADMRPCDIVGMYLTADTFQIYKRNEDSFKRIWSYDNKQKENNKGVWSLKIYKDTGWMRLDGAPTTRQNAAESLSDFNDSQLVLHKGSNVKDVGYEGPFSLATGSMCSNSPRFSPEAEQSLGIFLLGDDSKNKIGLVPIVLDVCSTGF